VGVVRTEPDRSGPAAGARREPRHGWTAAAVAAVTTAVALAQLFAGGPVGLADNGDGARIMCRLGLAGVTGSRGGASFDSHYLAVPPCPTGQDYSYETSWRLVVTAVRDLWRTVTGHSSFDLVLLAGTSSVLLGLATAALYLALPGPRAGRLLLCGLVTVAACDIGFVTYFDSPYSEPAGFIGLVAVLAGLVGVLVHRSWPWVVLLVGSVAFVGTAKLQLATVGVAVVAALLLGWRRWSRDRAGQGRWAVRRPGRALAAGLLGAGVLTGVVAAQQGPGFVAGNQMNLLFYTILAESPDPAADLRDMGLPPSLARYAGVSAWQPEAPYFDPALEASADRVYSWGTYAGFLVRHPDRLAGLVAHSVATVPDARVDYLGNVPVPKGAPPVLVTRPSPVFGLLGLLPDQPVLLVLWAAAAALGAWLCRSKDRALAVRGLLLVALSVYAVVQAVGALSDGYYELAKHEVHAAFATGLLLAVLADLAIGRGMAAISRRGRR
jgi:hypothetical protein